MFNFIKQNTQKLKDTVGNKLSEVPIQKYYDNVKKFIEDDDEEAGNEYEVLTNQTQSDKLQMIINKQSNISDTEKQFIFNYSKASPEKTQTGESLDRFAKNLIIVINSFFEYGFMEKGDQNNKEIKHYWELISVYFSSYSSVAYIQEFLGQTQKGQECALSWITLVLNEENVLFYCFHEIFKNKDFLSHYNEKTSYFHVNRFDLLDISKSIYQHKILINSKFNQKYQEYLKESLKIRLESNLKQQLQIESQRLHQVQNIIVHEEDSDEEYDQIQNDQDLFKDLPIQHEQENPQENYIEKNQHQQPIMHNEVQGGHSAQMKLLNFRKTSIQEEEDKLDIDLVVEESNFGLYTERDNNRQARLNLFSKNDIVDRRLNLSNQKNRSIKNEVIPFDDLSKITIGSNLLNGYIHNESRIDEHNSSYATPQSAIMHYSKNNIIQQRLSPRQTEKEKQKLPKQDMKKIFHIQGKEFQQSPDLSEISSSMFKTPVRRSPYLIRKSERPKRNQQNSFDSDVQQQQIPKYERGRTYYVSPVRGGTVKQVSSQLQRPIELKNSDCVFFNEFLLVFRRKEYTSGQVQKFFHQISKRINKSKFCHNCGNKLALAKIFKRCFCNFCMEYVCSKECLSTEKFIIPRAFNLEYDLEDKPVCSLAAVFLNRRNYMKIPNSHPQVAMQDKLYIFMIARRKLHKIYDMIKCDAYMNIIEKNGFASEKNLVLKDFFISIQQLVQFRQQILLRKVVEISNILLTHLKSCKMCDIKKNQCDVCLGGVLFYDYDIEVSGECNFCNKKGHLSCLNKHVCNTLTNF